MDGQRETIPLWATAIGGTTRPSLAEDVRALSNALLTRWKMIVIIVAASLLLGIGYLWLVEPVYRSTVDILVDPRARTLVGMDVVPAGLGSSSLGSDTGLVDSQVQILQSRSILGSVIEKLNLAGDGTREPASVFGGLATIVKSILYGPNSADYASLSPFDGALNELRSALKIERVGNTYVLRVTVSSQSPQGASDIANALAAEYVDQGQAAINDATRETAEALESRLAELKRTSDAAQQALETYRSANGLVGAAGVLVDEQQLRDLNDQVTRASVETEMVRARLAEVERLKREPASAVASANTLTSAAAEAIRLQLDAAVADVRALSGVYGKFHPTMVQALQKRASLEQALLQEFRRIEVRTASDYKTAQKSEEALKTLLKQYEARRSDSNEATIRLRELQSEADAARGIYDAFALRAAQTREQVDLPTNTSRVISGAEPASQPSEPRLTVVLAVAAFIGLVLALGTAWSLHLLRGTPAPTPTSGRDRRSSDRRVPLVDRDIPSRYAASAVQPIRHAVAGATSSGSARPRPLFGLFR